MQRHACWLFGAACPFLGPRRAGSPAGLIGCCGSQSRLTGDPGARRSHEYRAAAVHALVASATRISAFNALQVAVGEGGWGLHRAPSRPTRGLEYCYSPSYVTDNDTIGHGLLKRQFSGFPQLFPGFGQDRGRQDKVTACFGRNAVKIIQVLLRIRQGLTKLGQSSQSGGQFSHACLRARSGFLSGVQVRVHTSIKVYDRKQVSRRHESIPLLTGRLATSLAAFNLTPSTI